MELRKIAGLWFIFSSFASSILICSLFSFFCLCGLKFTILILVFPFAFHWAVFYFFIFSNEEALRWLLLSSSQVLLNIFWCPDFRCTDIGNCYIFFEVLTIYHCIMFFISGNFPCCGICSRWSKYSLFFFFWLGLVLYNYFCLCF